MTIAQVTTAQVTTAQTPASQATPRAFDSIAAFLDHYARVSPAREAILAPGRPALTYEALGRQTSEMVRKLRSFGVKRADRVAVVLPPGADSAVTLMAVASGAVCVPLHPGFSVSEWRRYFDELGVAALLTSTETDSSCRGVAYTLGLTVIDLSRSLSGASGELGLTCTAPRAPVEDTAASGSDIALMLLTSGTTARSKLVPLSQAAICLSAFNAGAAVALTAEDRLLSVLPFFHAHGLISGLLTALGAGSTIICPPAFDAEAFFGWLSTYRPSWYTAVPPIHRALLAAAPRHKKAIRQSSLRIIRSASQSLPANVLNELETLFGVPVIETYGMTEASSQIAANPIARRKVGSVGKPTGPEIAILDGNGHSLSPGEQGEVVLKGATITSGYYNNTAATEAAFRDGWFRTGDLGHIDADGYLFLAGRIKKADVINRGGQKISPAEVEDVLQSHPDVARAAVFPLVHKRLGDDVAAIVVLRPQATVTAEKLRRFASEHLARFKMPGLIQFVEEIPTASDGKIVRGELAARLGITATDHTGRDHHVTAPRSRTEWLLARSWAELLQLDEVGIDQDVFALGADSLTVTQLLLRVRTQFGVAISFRDILQAPTIAALAAHIDASHRDDAAAATDLEQLPTVETSPLSIQQQRIHLLSRLDQTGHKFHVLSAMQVSGPLDAGALQASIATVCQRHETLRSIFTETRGEPVQTATTIPPIIERVDLSALPKRERAAAVQMQAQQLLAQSFDLGRLPPVRVGLLKLADDDHVIVMLLHHLVTDGWSQRLLWDELGTIYAGRIKRAPDGLPPLPIQYRHVVAWQQRWLTTPAATEQLNYWRTRLDGLTELPLRTDFPKPEAWTGRGARYPLKLPRSLTRALKSLSRSHNVTLFMTLLAAFQCLLHRYTDHDDVAVGSLIANRNLIQAERLIGMFVNALVLRSDLSGDPSFSELLQRVAQVALDAYRHQDLPIERILQALNMPRSLDRNPLFRVMFILQKSAGNDFAGMKARFIEPDPEIARSDLLLELAEIDGSLQGWLEYSTELFASDTIARMATHLQTLLQSIVDDPDERISRLTLLPDTERQQILVDFNKTKSADRPGNFIARFARQVARAPEAIAVSTGTVQFSYRALAERADAITARLDRSKSASDDVVILFADRSVDLLAAMIAVQQAGLAFLPLDPALPQARLTGIVRHSGARTILTTTSQQAAVEVAMSDLPRKERPRLVVVDRLARASRRASAPVRRTPSSLACVIYTSGSTGVPKGAMIEDRGLVNHLQSKIDDLGLTSADVVAQTAPQSFVIALWQFLAPLMVGARVHICTESAVRDPLLLMQETSRERITILELVPSLLREILRPAPSAIAREALSRLRTLISTGEALTPDLCRDWFLHVPDVPLLNAYGATECSDDVATYRMTAPIQAATVPIGRPIRNTSLYVLDRHHQPVPIGIAGELHVGGAAVGRGYLNDDEQTRGRFMKDSLSGSRHGRLYRMGDLARWRADGTLECFGRVDHQIKIRGSRIELEEVEHVLMQHERVRSTGVVTRDDALGDRELIAWVVPSGPEQPRSGDLRDFLKSRLPAHMVPAACIIVDHLPLTHHGKLDRTTLAARTVQAAPQETGLVSPRTETERKLVAIWEDLLAAKAIGIHSNFFDLGGHSLLAGRVLARVAIIFGIALPIRALFEASTVEALAQRIDAAIARGDDDAQTAAIEDEGSPVSIAQEHMFRVEHKLPGLPQFNLAFAYRLRGPLNVAALDRSLMEVVRRHDSLRTGFASANGQPVAVIGSADEVRSFLRFDDLANGSAAGQRRAKMLLVRKAELIAEQEAWTAFDIAHPPLLRARLLRLGPDDHVLVLVLHHVVFDGWSIGVMFDDIAAAYAAITRGRRLDLTEPVPQFSKFARAQRSWGRTVAADRHIDYWKDNLRAARPVFSDDNTMTDRLMTSPIGHEPVQIPKDLIAQLTRLAQSHGSTLFMALLTGFKATLLARTGNTDLCVATAMANRGQQWTERVIGPVENTTLIRTRMDQDLSFLEALGRVRNAVLEAHARQELPFEVVSERLADEAGIDTGSLVQAFLVLQNAMQRPLRLSDVTIHSLGNVHREGQPVLPIDRTWLTLILKEHPFGIGGSCSYKEELFEASFVRNVIADYHGLLQRAVANPRTQLGRLIEQ